MSLSQKQPQQALLPHYTMMRKITTRLRAFQDELAARAVEAVAYSVEYVRRTERNPEYQHSHIFAGKEADSTPIDVFLSKDAADRYGRW